MLGLKKVKIRARDIRALSLPTLISIALAVLIYVSGNFAYSEIRGQYDGLNKSIDKENLLDEKLLSLSQVRAANLDSSNKAVIALPVSNPGLFFLTQLSSLSQKYSVNVTNRQVGSGAKLNEEISRAGVSVSIESTDLASIIGFLKDTQNVAPLSTIKSVGIDDRQDSFLVEVEFETYWSPFPESLPPLESSIKELSVKDREALTKVLGLASPSFTILDPNPPMTRSNPFQ